MNKTLLIIGVLAVLLVGGFIVWNSYYPITQPGTETTDTTDTTGGDTTLVPKVPTVVTSPNAFPSDTTVVVSGTITPNGPATTYWYEFGTSATFGSKTPTQTIGSGFREIPAPLYITGLVKDTTYYYRLVASNQVGTTAGTSYTFRTTVGTPAPVGSVPTLKTLAASGVSRTSANLAGEVTPNKAATKYWFEYGTTQNLGSATALESAGDGSVKVPASFALTNLAPSTTYYYRINAQNQFGTVNGGILSFKTTGPAVAVISVVTTQVASSIGTTTATLRGTVNPYNTPTMYWFEYGTDTNFGSGSSNATSQKSAGAGATTVGIEANVSSLKANTTYYYRVVAQNAAGTVRGETFDFKTK
jgi:phosphodiesterase/alkaline phosphatase D-like protein